MRGDSALFYVVGNGPSLKTSVLDSLPDGYWLGMNAAYKYWDRTGRYPYFYACLDPVVILQHKDAITRLLREGKIAEFFLHEEILTAVPDLAAHPRVTLRNDFMAKEGALRISSMSRSKQTTGVLGVRFCIERGFRNLCLLGIDCNYVETLDEATSGHGYELVIEDSVRRNPNYFFDDYQEKNERYQVPNPEIHSGNLHLQSFLALRNDIKSSAIEVRISVASRESLLSKFCIFPDMDVTAHLGKRRLEAIAVPLTPSELDGFLKGLECWVDPKLQPSFSKIEGVVLHIFMSCGERPEVRRKIEEAAESLPWLSHYFSELRLTFIDLPPDVDYYVKGTSLNVFCNKSGPNIFWLMIMAACREYSFTFQMEADCVPMRMGWLDALERSVVATREGVWVIGANYYGPTMVSAANAFHINGNAIYATGSREFQKYLEEDYLRALKWIVENVSNSAAYDIAFARGVGRYEEILGSTGVDLRKYVWRHTFSPVIRNMNGQAETEGSCPPDIMGELRSDPEMFLCHGQPALRVMSREFHNLHSFYLDDAQTVRELRVQNVKSLTKCVSWKNRGFGRIDGMLHPDRDSWPDALCMAIEARSDTVIVGVVELGFVLPSSCTLSGVYVSDDPGQERKELTSVARVTDGKDVTIRFDARTLGSQARRILLELTFARTSRDKGVASDISGLRLLCYPPASAPMAPEIVPKTAHMTELEKSWREWIVENQGKLDDRLGFITCDQSEALPILREVLPSSALEYSTGTAKLAVGEDTPIQFRFSTRSQLEVDPEVRVMVRMRAERNCEVSLGGKAFDEEEVVSVQRVRAGISAEVSVGFRLRKPKDSDFFITVDAKVDEPVRQKFSMIMEELRIQKTPEFLLQSKRPTFRRIISVNPDAESFFGHFLNYESRLGRAVTARGIEHIIAGPVDGEPAIYTAHPELAPVFTVRTKVLYAKNPGEEVPTLTDFEVELDRYLAGIDQTTPSLLFMYCGSLEIAEVFSRLADKYPSCIFAISLYYLSWLNLTSPEMRAYWKPRLMAMAQHPSVRLIVPSPELADMLRTHFGVSPEVLPHPSTSFDDAEVRTMEAGTTERGDKGVTVVFPGNQRGGKGYELTRDAIRALFAASSKGVKLRVRRPPDDSYSKPRREFFDSIRDQVEVLDSYLDEDAFRALLRSADIVALPYTPDRFANRTSGLLIDSLLLGIPCVVIRGTWLERTVNEYGFGIATDQDGKAMAEGILDAARRIRSLKTAALAGRARYLEKNSWKGLVDYLTVASPLEIPSMSALAAPAVAGTNHKEYAQGVHKRRLLIIGNGPSTRVLAEAGFHKLPADMDTWGTTAAYRYFERVGWWPTYYALADRKVVFNHRENLARLLNDPKVTTKKFFLSRKVSDSPRMELIPHSSTGSFSLMKALELGYKEIYLIGMEGAYVEEVAESRPLAPEEIANRGFGVLNLSRAESKLRIIERTPTFNPNYFFSDYQQEGDVYSLPQAHTHQANWDQVASAIKREGARVINLSRISKIDAFERGDIREVFPYLPEDCWEDIWEIPEERMQHPKSDCEIIAISGFTRTSETAWSYRAAENRDGVLLATFSHVGVTAGHSLVAGVRLIANRDVKLNITFGREGRTDCETTEQEIALKGGEPLTTVLSTRFQKSHDELRFRISRHDLCGDSIFELTVENLWLTESVDSVVARHAVTELTEGRAALAFADGNFSLALAIWLWLAYQEDKSGHAEKIARVAPAIGMSADLIDSDRLLELLALAPLDSVAPKPSQPVVNQGADVVTSGDLLDQLGSVVLESGGDGGHAASMLLRSVATALLLDPQKTLPRLDKGKLLAKAVDTAQQVLSDTAPLQQHFIRVLDHARARTCEKIS